MESFASYAVFACVIVSGLGGIVICCVALRYGLAPPAEDDPIELTHRRLFATHLAHAFAAVAFAVTAALAAAALLVKSPPPAVASEGADLHVVAQRLDAVESMVRRMTDRLEHSVRRLEQSEAVAGRR